VDVISSDKSHSQAEEGPTEVTEGGEQQPELMQPEAAEYPGHKQAA
jgi:hypothetical protein